MVKFLLAILKKQKSESRFLRDQDDDKKKPTNQTIIYLFGKQALGWHLYVTGATFVIIKTRH